MIELKKLKKKYSDRDLLTELAYGCVYTRRGYLSKQDADFTKWLCGAAYEEICALKKQLKTGCWNQNGGTYECSECGWEYYDELQLTNYCPSCGAKMKEARRRWDRHENKNTD